MPDIPTILALRKVDIQARHHGLRCFYLDGKVDVAEVREFAVQGIGSYILSRDLFI